MVDTLLLLKTQGINFSQAQPSIKMEIINALDQLYGSGYASRSGTPIDIVSKVIQGNANISTIQRYLGKVSDLEAIRRVDNLHE